MQWACYNLGWANVSREIEVLIYATLGEIEEVDSKLTPAIKAFREGTLQIRPGGGGLPRIYRSRDWWFKSISQDFD